MADARPFINTFLTHVVGLPKTYELYFTNPYFRAYGEAQGRIAAVLGAQAKSDRLAMELAMVAFSVVGGGMLTRVFASTALKTVAADVALDVICKKNLTNAFKVMSWVDDNATAKFVVGSLWDTGENILSGKMKESLQAKLEQFPSMTKFGQSPGAVQSHLNDFVTATHLKIKAVATDILNNPKLSEDQKIAAIKKLEKSSFCSPSMTAPNEPELSANIELAWWMNFVLKRDYLRKKNWWGGGSGSGGSRVVYDKPIAAMPGSANYPRAGSTYTTHGSGFSTRASGTTTDIYYKSMGSDIRKGISSAYRVSKGVDEAFKKRMGQQFFKHGTIQSETLLRAKMTLQKLGENSNLKLAKQALAGK